jgi:hypothetical protein
VLRPIQFKSRITIPVEKVINLINIRAKLNRWIEYEKLAIEQGRKRIKKIILSL